MYDCQWGLILADNDRYCLLTVNIRKTTSITEAVTNIGVSSARWLRSSPLIQLHALDSARSLRRPLHYHTFHCWEVFQDSLTASATPSKSTGMCKRARNFCGGELRAYRLNMAVAYDDTDSSEWHLLALPLKQRQTATHFLSVALRLRVAHTAWRCCCQKHCWLACWSQSCPSWSHIAVSIYPLTYLGSRTVYRNGCTWVRLHNHRDHPMSNANFWL